MGPLFHPLSVKSKAALVTTAGVLVLFTAFTVFEMRRVKAEIQAVLGAQQLTLISSIADELDDKIRSTHGALIVTAEATTPKMLANLPAMERNLRDQPGYRSLFDDVFVIGRDGRVLIDLPVLKRRGIDVSDRDYFRGTLDTRKPVISEPYMGRGLKEPSVTMTAPILNSTGEVVGMLTGVIHPLKPNFLGKLREARVGTTGRFILFSRDRAIIVSRDVTRIMTKGPEPGVRSYLDNAMAGREGWEESTNSRGQRALYSYKPLGSVPWVLVAVLPVEEAYAPIAAARARAVGIAALLALLLAPLVWFGMQYVLSPIGVLRDTIRKIRSDPESDAPVQMPRQDELGDLAEDFSAMTRERRRANQALRESEERYRSLAELSSDWYWEQDEHYRFLPLSGDNSHAERHLWRGGQAGKTRWDLPDTDLTPAQWAEHRALLDARQPFHDFEYSRVGSDGVRHYVRISGEPIFDASGKFKGYRGVGKDVTERKRAESLQRQSEERFAKIFQASPDAIVISRLKDGRYLDVNQRWLELFGYTREELIGRSSLDLGIWVDRADRTRFVEQIRERGALRDFEVRFRRKSGAIIDGLISAEPIEIDGEPHVIVPVQDVTDRKRAEARIQQLATRDPLTGLPNRLLLTDRLALSISHAQRSGGRLALLFIDLDRFKYINDSLGHVIGDAFLRAVAERLSGIMRKGDTLARLGGDEFVVLLENIVAMEDAAGQVARKILSSLTEPFSVQGHALSCSCSIGISVFPSDTTDPQMLIRDADTAMYHAKESGRGSYRYFSAEMNTRVQERLQVENGLRDALARGQFELAYQPKCNVSTGKVTGFEALLRWRHPSWGVVAPGRFISVAEESGLIGDIGRWVLKEVCRQLHDWQGRSLPVHPVAINLSVRQFTSSLISDVSTALHDFHIEPDLIQFEITENLFIRNPEDISAILKGLAEIGTHVAVDDFGTGYSSLRYVKQFAVDALKIDRSFIADLTGNSQDDAIVRAIIMMAHGLGIRVIAEGVETQGQLKLLQNLQCDEYQGFLVSAPLHARQVEHDYMIAA